MPVLLLLSLLGLGLVLPVSALAAAGDVAHPADVAFFYGAKPPVAVLRHHERVVVEPGNIGPDELAALQAGTRPIAYLGVGETPLEEDLPADWAMGTNPAWESRVMDLTRPGWREHLLERASALAGAGYSGFFLDTLDSYRLAVTSEEGRKAQRKALVAFIRELARRHPELELWLNRGFEVLDAVHAVASGVVAESLFRGYLPREDRYDAVSEENRRWLAARLREVREHHDLPVVVVDYVPEAKRDLARQTARKIVDAGFSPYVSVGSLDMPGVGLREPVPRRLLVVYDGGTEALEVAPAFEEAAPILEYLGYAIDYVNASAGEFPEFRLAGRYAGVVSWFAEGLGAAQPRWEQWLRQRVIGRVPLALLGNPSIQSEALWRALGMAATALSPPAEVAITRRGPLGRGFEAEPRARRLGLPGLHSVGTENRVQIGLEGGGGRWDPVVLGPWGGLAASPYVLESVGTEGRTRWQIDPFRFFERALGGVAFPAPDPTTENGLRILTAHIDGDAFPSRAAMPGRPYSAEVIRERILERNRFPHTVSVVEGEIGPEGLYPEQSPAMEAIARAIYRLPHVEAGSHSFSHPFDWSAAAAEGEGVGIEKGARPDYGDALKYGVHLPIPGYDYDVQREVAGSSRYIERALLPGDKRVRVFHWTGDAWPDAEAVSAAYRAGLGNINGGNTAMTEAFPSVTGLSPMIRPTTGGLQFLAPIANENVFTDGWQGPFYGYRRVLETFRLTGSPRRLRPVSLYYHFYSGTNPAGVKALERVYAFVRERELLALWISEYLDRLRGFHEATLSRELDGKHWRVRDLHGLRTLRLPQEMPAPGVRQGSGVVGVRTAAVGRYASLFGAEATLVMDGKGQASGPGLHTANAPLTHWAVQGADTVTLGFRTLGPVKLVIDRPGCLARTGGLVVRGGSEAGRTHMTLQPGAAERARIVCP
ncbi:endo alpha-1,4 polygalactosaminidase [Ectothiorhodospiraceae bacterium WFHF3C12]|nr:endo alpha-1,4 polygalactosaminidase [Ectothiorhodospiraceae bacterium WFHF3C12]